MSGETRSFVQALTEVSTVAKQEMGTIRKEGKKWYKYIQYESGAGAVAGTSGNACYYDSTAGYLNSLVTCDLSDSDELPAGQLMATLADDEYGWVQIKGFGPILPTDVVAGAVGDPLTPTGATDGTLDVIAASTSAVAGYLVDATGSSQRVALDCII